MDFSALIPGLLLGLTALVIIIYCLGLLLRNLPIFRFRGTWEERALLKHKKFLAKARAFMEQGQYQQCYPLLQQAFYLRQIKSSESMVQRVLEHHLAILSAVLTLSERYPVPLSNLPMIEELVQIRAALCKSYLDAALTVKKLAIKNAESGRKSASPKWAIHAFSQKTEELIEKINTNQKSLESELIKLFSGIKHSANLSEVTYH
ncbi:MAG: hypothetical protein GX589_07540 [Deltaproteobacteria bacterium]|nr:hypothetical protein [Deltaproteobacteria bacterium]